MKAKMIKTVEIDVKFVKVSVAVRYEEENIPNDFPLRSGDVWSATIEVDTGKIVEWPEGKSGHLQMKVCDEGSYSLIDSEGQTVAEKINYYCPNHLIPGEYGDYIDLEINEQGIVTNWPKHPKLDDFEEFNTEE